MNWQPLIILAVGLCIVVGSIVWLRVHAFLALIIAAIAVSLMAPVNMAQLEAKGVSVGSEKIVRVVEAFGTTVGKIGIIIALAAIIGKAMTDSGAADRIVRMFLEVLGEKRCAAALMMSGFTLAVPVFFDTVFYLMLPLVRTLHRRIGKHYVKMLMAVVCSVTAHALVPPTPGPLAAAANLRVDLGIMIWVGCLVGFPASMVGLWYASWLDRKMPDKQPPAVATEAPAAMARQPHLLLALSPIIVPVVLISLNTAAEAYVKSSAMQSAAAAGGPALGAAATTAEPALSPLLVSAAASIGNPNLALLISMVLAVGTWWHHCRPKRGVIMAGIEESLMTAGVIILITSAGGAFGAMLSAAQIDLAIKQMFGNSAAGGFGILILAFCVSALLRFAQGSTTAAMIVTSAMISAMIFPIAPDAAPINLGFHPVYLVTAIGSGGLVLSWMNDSGFWIFSRMGGFTEVETLRTWTPMLTMLGLVAMAMTLLLAAIMPMSLAP
jgi:gluconate:H+ symporter, GntP family